MKPKLKWIKIGPRRWKVEYPKIVLELFWNPLIGFYLFKCNAWFSKHGDWTFLGGSNANKAKLAVENWLLCRVKEQLKVLNGIKKTLEQKEPKS